MFDVSTFLRVGVSSGVLALSIWTQAPCAENVRLQTDPPQQLDVPFRLFRTENMWNQLLLDTRTGELWQVSFTVSDDSVRSKIPLNLTPLASGKNAVIGRFTLYPTDNIWNFLLLDQIDGRVWQCQFSVSSGNVRGCVPIFVAEIKTRKRVEERPEQMPRDSTTEQLQKSGKEREQEEGLQK
jgi:hypothetical protein